MLFKGLGLCPCNNTVPDTNIYLAPLQRLWGNLSKGNRILFQASIYSCELLMPVSEKLPAMIRDISWKLMWDSKNYEKIVHINPMPPIEFLVVWTNIWHMPHRKVEIWCCVSSFGNNSMRISHRHPKWWMGLGRCIKPTSNMAIVGIYVKLLGRNHPFLLEGYTFDYWLTFNTQNRYVHWKTGNHQLLGVSFSNINYI